MVRTLVCTVVLFGVVPALLPAEPDRGVEGNPPNQVAAPNPTKIQGVIEKIDVERGLLFVMTKSKSGENATIEYKIEESTRVIFTVGPLKRHLMGKAGLKSDQVKVGYAVTVLLDKGQKVVEVEIENPGIGKKEVTAEEMWADQRKWYTALVGYANLVKSVPRLPNGSLSAAIVMERNTMPDINDVELAGKEFMLMNKDAKVGDHFTRGTKRLCGSLSSMTPGIGHVQAYEFYGSSGWASSVLRVDSAEGPLGYDDLNQRLKSILRRDTAPNPLSDSDISFRIISGVVTGWLGKNHQIDQYLRRSDALIDRDDILQTHIIYNNTDNKPESLAYMAKTCFMTQAYNVLAVSNVTGSILGPTLIEVTGRAKPDLVVPLATPSQSGPGASSAVVLLAECALTQKKPHAAKPYMLRSLLMTGAKKQPSWGRGNRTPKEQEERQIPLDYRQGAGMLQVDRSYAILQQPEAEPGKLASMTGWSQAQIAEGQSKNYFFTLDQSQEFAATLVWHRHIVEYGLTDKSLLNDLDLYLYRAEPGSSPQEWGNPVEYSVSRIDNVEHMFLPTLPAGKYVLSVVAKDVKKFSLPGRAEQPGESYGLSWQALPLNR